jgi:hypothetical protein
MIVMLDYQHNIVRQRKKDVRDGGEEREGREKGVRAKDGKAKEGRAKQSKGEQNGTEEAERAGEGRGEEGRRGGVEVMMWQRQKGLREIFVAKDSICKYSHEGEILGSRFDLGLKSGPRL